MTYTDTAFLLHVRLADLVQLETLRAFPYGDTLTVIRTARLSARFADTLSQASSSLQDYHSADTSQTITQRTSYGPKQKRGVAWLRSQLTFAVVIIFLLFLLWVLCVKKK